MEIIVEVVLEIVVQVVGELLIELGLQSAKSATQDRPNANPVLACVAYLLFGFALGGLSALLWERRIAADGLALLNLFASPLLAGLALHAFGRWRRARGFKTTNLATFWGGASLAFGTALARFVFA